MASFVAVPLKKTDETDLVKPLKNLISENCKPIDKSFNFDNSLTELNKLRINSTCKTLNVHEKSLETLSKYYDQLCFFDIKCLSKDFQIPFKWQNAFDKGSLFFGSTALTLSNLLYEKVCILFNIAALQSHIAVNHGNDIHNDDGLKLSAKYFQMSSGIFEHLKNMVNQLHESPTPDLQPDNLLALSTLMLAQAQESFFYKAMSDKMKEAVIAKVASQCDTLYAETFKLMQKEINHIVWDKEWLSIILGKQVGFKALAEYYQSVVCKNKTEVGEEIARLKLADEFLKLADVRGNGTFTLAKDFEKKVTQALIEAKKDNDFIYHARVPESKALPPIGKAAIAKLTPLPEKLFSSSQDLFPDLFPLPVNQAMQAFKGRKAELIKNEKTKIDRQMLLLNRTLKSLNLSELLKTTTTDVTLSQSDKSKCSTFYDPLQKNEELFKKNEMPVEQSSAMEKLKILEKQSKGLLDISNALKDELDGVTTDIRMKFLLVLSREGSINEQTLSQEILEEIYGPIRKKIKENLEKQDKIIEEIQSVSSTLKPSSTKSKKNDGSISGKGDENISKKDDKNTQEESSCVIS